VEQNKVQVESRVVLPTKVENGLLRAVEHVLVDAGRMQAVPIKKLMTLESLAKFDGLPSSRGGTLPTRQRSISHLRWCCELALSHSDYAGRLDSSVVYRNFKEEISRRFIRERKRLNVRSARAAFSAAVIAAARHTYDGLYYFACNITDGAQPSELALGPVKFMPASQAFLRSSAAFDGLRVCSCCAP
jgi:hypothetical protein